MAKLNLKKTIVAGTAAGVISGLVKLGWENILPPRTAERDKVNPPQTLLQQLGVPAKLTQATYQYSGQQLPWVSYLVHFGFSISFATAYAALLEKKVKLLTIGQGIPFGLAVWIAFHLVIMPAMGTVPSAKEQPEEEHLSESLGHAIWMWTNHEIAETVLHQLNKK
ncbi:periplasmic secreted protein [Limosilactobacillus frumenti DSM 13145]|uniref:Periplasmic secreted protein n=1 Tax=Limosilactobacillus frumenti DSM 13145 TaxID=1423746 RepID=A0A0R1PCC8_9LACO|nr:DUF1440 domain-containing protein [Limosilactobacillus frumenti]KRL27794.1 periplasmic secreted protein [Limosilactobacillus frumenti DSM 13145]MBA2914428.1 DUF1440 domain-containing protein [Limosilactobacillus frumenti]QFG73348.1 DUF1440 domain-containing protein [Limosilactobacillus frumenti]